MHAQVVAPHGQCVWGFGMHAQVIAPHGQPAHGPNSQWSQTPLHGLKTSGTRRPRSLPRKDMP